jgi:hypothetical protein
MSDSDSDSSSNGNGNGIDKNIINDVINNALNSNGDNDENEDSSVGIGDIMNDITSQIKNMMKETSKAPADLKEHYEAFVAAINWKETFIRCIIISHIILFILMILTRKNVDIQCMLFLSICFFIYISEYINTWCHNHWQLFATQDYFDKQGVFSSMMFSGPLLAMLFVQLLNFLALASSTLIQVKRMELKQKIKKEQANKDTDNTDNTTNTLNIDNTDSSNNNSSSSTQTTRRTRSSKK